MTTTPTPFRSHDAIPAHRGSVFGALTTEWVDINSSRSPALTVQRWATNHPVLAGCTRPADIVDAVEAAAADRQDALLLTLLQLTQDGEELAGRILLQQMLPRLARLHRRIKTSGSADYSQQADRQHIIVATFWEVIATYPIQRRPTRVAANLALDTLGKVHRIADRNNDVLLHDAIDNGFLDLHTEAHPAPSPAIADPDMPQILTWATDTGILTDAAAHLLNDIYAQGETPLDYSRRTGISHDNVKQQCRRAKLRLRAALDTTTTASNVA